MYGLTITNNIQTQYVSVSKEIVKFQRFEYKGVTVKPKKVKYVQSEKDLVSNPDEDAVISEIPVSEVNTNTQVTPMEKEDPSPESKTEAPDTKTEV